MLQEIYNNRLFIPFLFSLQIQLLRIMCPLYPRFTQFSIHDYIIACYPIYSPSNHGTISRYFPIYCPSTYAISTCYPIYQPSTQGISLFCYLPIYYTKHHFVLAIYPPCARGIICLFVSIHTVQKASFCVFLSTHPLDKTSLILILFDNDNNK